MFYRAGKKNMLETLTSKVRRIWLWQYVYVVFCTSLTCPLFYAVINGWTWLNWHSLRPVTNGYTWLGGQRRWNHCSKSLQVDVLVAAAHGVGSVDQDFPVGRNVAKHRPAESWAARAGLQMAAGVKQPRRMMSNDGSEWINHLTKVISCNIMNHLIMLMMFQNDHLEQV